MRRSVIVIFLLLFPFSLYAAEITKSFKVSGALTSVFQSLDRSRGEVPQKGRVSAALDISLEYMPREEDQFFLKVSFAEGSGLSSYSRYPFYVSCNADNLERDLRDINGRGRDNLLEVWYARTFKLKGDLSLRFTGGIIDSATFIDENEYAGDEIGQFMNEAFVRNPLANLPSYDWGGALEFLGKRSSFRIVGMSSKNENELLPKKSYSWVGAQLGVNLSTGIGDGNYRIYGYTTNKRFEDWEGQNYKRLRGFGLSFDQEIVKEIMNAFFRLGTQSDSAKVDYKNMLSFGLNFSGKAWKRAKDEIGMGYAYLKSPKRKEDVKRTNVFEAYFKLHLLEYKFLSSDITFDYQYISENLKEATKRAGNILGARLNVSF
ncbi:MAG: carbohydrate porin [Deltaproteobacteria bacterium]|nr:carbohydrate porin [Deltaproteobacteria bacterium]